MNNWWQIAFSGMCLVALGTLALGIWIGHGIGQDRAAEAEAAARFAAVPDPGRHRLAEPRRLPTAPKQATGSTAEMFARLEAEVATRTVPMQQRPLGQLVESAREHRPGRTTDFIAAMQADVDQYIARMGASR